MTFIDTHSHIYLDEFLDDREKMLERAREAGVSRILLPAVDTETHLGLLQLEESYPTLCASMMGLHPCSVKSNYEEELRVVKDELSRRKFIGVGEIGLDFYWDLTFQDHQYQAFHEQLELALHYDLPVSIHSRNATAECIKVVREHQNGSLKGAFHCFSGTVEEAREIIDLGFYLGIGGVLTFKNGGLDPVIKELDLDHIILETDAPYLAPVPFRGKRNEPSYLKYIAQRMADIKETGIESIAEMTTKNAEKLFGLNPNPVR